MRRTIITTFAFLSMCASAAYASTIPAGTYYLDDAYVDGYSLTGTVTFGSNGTATAADLVFNDAAFDNPGLPTFDVISTGNAYSNLGQEYIVGNGYGTGQVALYIQAVPDGGDYDLCLNNGPCGTSTGDSTLQIYGYYSGVSNPGLPVTNISSGYLSTSPNSVGATPEPSSLALLGTGILGAAGLVRRRFIRG